MAPETQIAQVIATLPNLTVDQLDALAKFDTAPLDSAIETAESKHEFTADRALSVVVGYIPEGARQMARVAILGILTDDSTLTKPWTDVAGEFVVTPDAPVAVTGGAETLDTSVDTSSGNAVSTQPNAQIGQSAGDQSVLPTQEFTAILAPQSESGNARQVRVMKIVNLDDPTFEAYLEVGTNDVWLPEQLTDLNPSTPADPAAGAI